VTFVERVPTKGPGSGLLLTRNYCCINNSLHDLRQAWSGGLGYDRDRAKEKFSQTKPNCKAFDKERYIGKIVSN
jgi:hypothetical protein